MTWTCQRVAAVLPGFVDDELPRPELEAVRVHLRGCGGCRRQAADYLQAIQSLRRVAVAEAGDDRPTASFAPSHDDIMAAVAAAEAGPVQRWPMRVASVAAAVLLAAAGFWLAGLGDPGSIWERNGTPIPIHDPGVPVTPYVGSPLEIYPVGLDEVGGAEYGIGPGMSGRGSMRSEIEVLPAVYEVEVLPAVYYERREPNAINR